MISKKVISIRTKIPESDMVISILDDARAMFEVEIEILGACGVSINYAFARFSGGAMDIEAALFFVNNHLGN